METYRLAYSVPEICEITGYTTAQVAYRCYLKRGRRQLVYGRDWFIKEWRRGFLLRHERRITVIGLWRLMGLV